MSLIKSTNVSTTMLFVSMVLAGCVGIGSDGTAEPTSQVTSASSADCSGGANGFVDIPDTQSGTVQRLFTVRDNLATARVTQESATISGTSRGYAKFSGATLAGDQLWMDWSEDGGAHTRIQCGPFTVPSNNASITTAALTTSDSQRRFRACARPVNSNVSICNNWW